MGSSAAKPRLETGGAWLISLINKGEAFAWAERYGFPRAVVLEPDERGCTPLHVAATQHCLPVVAAAVREAGDMLTTQDFLTPNRRGWTPLHNAAAAEGMWEVAAILREAGETLLVRHLLTPDLDGDTPLHAAAHAKGLASLHVAVRKAGQRLGVQDWLAENEEGISPMEAAAFAENLREVFWPEEWQGRLAEMAELWRHVPEKYREQVDFEKAAHEAALLSRPRLEAASFRGAARPSIPLPEKEGHGRRW
ncbi:MAG: ankyrin repeat domain-containing protein [Verrucomicrobium sp.]|nr:ankyrin repeat domain-containing protein [Verrucomicrobium sp.]